MSKTENIYHEFSAMQLYRMDCVSKQTIPVRWGALREDLKEKHLNTAAQQVAAWAEDEEAARIRRGSNPRAFFEEKATK